MPRHLRHSRPSARPRRAMLFARVLALAACTTLGATAVLVAATPPVSPVAEAAMKGDLTTVRALIAKGARVNAPQGDGMTALHWAADHGDSAMATLLLRAHADVKAVTRNGAYTPLHIAIRNGNVAIVKALLRAGSDANAPTEAGATPLHLAAGAGNVGVITALIERGANVNAKEPQWGQTPLIFAAANDRAAAIRVLIKKGADVNLRTKMVNLQEEGAREQAAARKRNEVLVSFEPEKHKPGADSAALAAARRAAGAAAMMRGSDSVVDARGARSYDTTGTGTGAGGGGAAAFGARGGRGGGPQPKGPFTAAQIQAAIDSGRAMLKSGAPVGGRGFTEQVDTINGGVAGYVGSVGGQGGLTALHHAVREGNLAAVEALLDGGANINDPNSVDQTTPLLMSLINGQFDVAKVLIEHGANPNIASSAGNTPLYAVINTQWAPRSRFPQPQDLQNQKTSYLDLMAALLKAGANPNARLKSQFWYFSYNNCGNANCGLENIDGTTPFWRAAYALDVDAMKMLVKAGADPTVPSQRVQAAGGRGGGRGRSAPGGGAPGGGAPGGAGGATAATGDTAAARTMAGAGGAAAQAGGGGGGGGGGAGGGRGQIPPPTAADPAIDSAAKAVPPGSGVYPIHEAAGVGYGNGFAGNSHRHVPEGWMAAMKYLVEELHADVNQRDQNGYTPLHHAASRGDTAMISYLVSKGADPKAVALNFRTTADMANGPVQRLRPFPDAITLLEKLGSKNSHRCVGC